VTDIKKGLAELLRADGFACVAEAVGAPTAPTDAYSESLGAAEAPS
jgi:hypothetical protein